MVNTSGVFFSLGVIHGLRSCCEADWDPPFEKEILDDGKCSSIIENIICAFNSRGDGISVL